MNNNCCFVSVVIPTRNCREYLYRCLKAIRQSDYHDFEVIVVDDASEDEFPEVVRSYIDRVIILRKRVGPGKARNIAAQQARGEIVFFIDSDVEIKLNTLTKAVEFLKEHTDIAALFGSYDSNPDCLNFFSQYKNLFHYFVHQNSNPEAKTFWSGCGAIRKDVFLEIGGFPEKNINAMIEDVELGHKLISKNYKIRLIKELQVKHLKRWDLVSLIKTDIFSRIIPWTRLAFKSGLPYDLNFKVKDRISGVLSLLIPFSLLFFFYSKLFLFFSMLLLTIFIYLNRSLCKFFMHKMGFSFSVGAIFFNWFYFFYSSIVFCCYSLILLVRNLCRIKESELI